jgi:uncharacterized membrane protein YfcA
MFSDSAGELALLALTIAVGGVITGILAGMFGIGGGAIIVPNTIRAARCRCDWRSRARSFCLPNGRCDLG